MLVMSLLNADSATRAPQRRVFVRLCFWWVTSFINLGSTSPMQQSLQCWLALHELIVGLATCGSSGERVISSVPFLLPVFWAAIRESKP